ncbi:hypothetical protein PIB30_033244 [Stylosanthes scabra]|uniref:Pentatricopeptide repeat-containing protein n=1 Tax=Stylosanthes scabra TaxID=79078 RepID=A0ABU6WAW3_9FABA|nr:hypothetical protein [Stylosanthes scabra]
MPPPASPLPQRKQALLLLRQPHILPESPNRPRCPLLKPPKSQTQVFHLTFTSGTLTSSPQNPSPPPAFSLSSSPRISPIVRFIIDAFRKNRYTWGPSVVSELNKRRRVIPPSLLRFLSSKQTLPLRPSSSIGLVSRKGKPPSENQFEILIRILSFANRGLRVYYVYEKTKKFGVKPRVSFYNRVMDALVKTNHLDLALSAYDNFREDGLVEEAVNFMILIKGLCKAGRIGEMLEVLERMRVNLGKPDVFAYTTLVQMLVPGGNLDGCLRVSTEKKKDKVEPDVMAYATIIIRLSKAGRVEEG